MNNRITTIFFNKFILFLFLLSGCTSRDKSLFSFGSFIFAFLSASIAIKYAVKYIHRNEKAKKIIAMLKIPKIAILLSYPIYAFSVLIIFFGLLFAWIEDGFSPKRLTFFLGVILFLLAHFMKKWGTSPFEEKSHYARLVVACFGAVAAMAYIMIGAPNIN